MKPLNQDIFCFYNLKVDLPKSFFEKLGDEAIVAEYQQEAVKYAVINMWPMVRISN
jgi:hypothetical protein